MWTGAVGRVQRTHQEATRCTEGRVRRQRVCSGWRVAGGDMSARRVTVMR